jgi:hypothetical protein
MIYFKSIIGGLVALLLFFLCLIIWVRNKVPRDATVGFNPEHLFLPKTLTIATVIFIIGFAIVWVVSRK